MKIIVIFTWALFWSCAVNAQYTQTEPEESEDEEQKGFQKNKLFTGGSVTLVFSSDVTAIGLSPIFGYSLTKWLDAGIVINYNHITERNYAFYSYEDKLKQNTLGPGAFVRLYPVKFLFAHAQVEKNFIKQTLIPDNDVYPRESIKVNAGSLLVGAGYCQGREEPGSMFYYFSVMFDVLKNKYSPYLQETENGKLNAVPMFRAGIQVPLFQGKPLL